MKKERIESKPVIPKALASVPPVAKTCQSTVKIPRGEDPIVQEPNVEAVTAKSVVVPTASVPRTNVDGERVAEPAVEATSVVVACDQPRARVFRTPTNDEGGEERLVRENVEPAAGAGALTLSQELTKRQRILAEKQESPKSSDAVVAARSGSPRTCGG